MAALKQTLVEFFLTWGDSLWLLAALLIPRRRAHKIYALAYVAACMLMMRLQIELLFDLDYPRGILPLMDMPLYYRGLWAYGTVHVPYFLLAYFSPGSRNIIFMAFSITLFFAGLTLSSLMLVL